MHRRFMETLIGGCCTVLHVCREVPEITPDFFSYFPPTENSTFVL
jgi:hypothetical protein